MTRKRIITGSIIVLIVGVGGYFIFFRHTTTPQFVRVQRGSITESVSLTGNTAPAQSVSLAFGSSGIISSTNSSLGSRVYAGQVLAELNTNDLVAGLRQAQANVAAQQVKLEGLQAGSRPEDIAASQAALDKVTQDLANMYAGIGDTSTDAYTKANDAVRTQLEQLFSHAESESPTLSYLVADFQTQIDTEAQRLAASATLHTWQSQLTPIDQSRTGLEMLLQNEVSSLTTIRHLLNSVLKTLDSAPALSASTLDMYRASVSAALNEVNTASKNLNTISQNIASQKLTVSQSQALLDLKHAGSLPTDISAQEAQVAQALSSVESAQAKLQNARIVAPISGMVTQFDTKVGQFASPGTPLISIMSNTGYEVDAGVSETDIGKIVLGNTVTMTLDAFPGETFSGSVFYIAPAETNTQGVVSYHIKISLDKPDPRLKSGLTANITIQTKQRDTVLFLPQYAIVQNDQGTFVETLLNNKVIQTPVTLGIQDEKGNVEILSGVTDGEPVLTIGLKSPQ